MIGQYLPNNNEKATVSILQKKFASEPALSSWLSGKNGEEKDFINYFVEFVELVNYDSLNG
jgi:hypothetical protein